MKCPSCFSQVADDAADCPGCGIIIAKFLARQEKEKRLAEEAKQKEERLAEEAKHSDKLEAAKFLVVAEQPAPVAINPWIGRVIALSLVVICWGLLALLTFRGPRRALRPVKAAPAVAP